MNTCYFPKPFHFAARLGRQMLALCVTLGLMVPLVGATPVRYVLMDASLPYDKNATSQPLLARAVFNDASLTPYRDNSGTPLSFTWAHIKILAIDANGDIDTTYNGSFYGNGSSGPDYLEQINMTDGATCDTAGGGMVAGGSSLGTFQSGVLIPQVFFGFNGNGLPGRIGPLTRGVYRLFVASTKTFYCSSIAPIRPAFYTLSVRPDIPASDNLYSHSLLGPCNDDPENGNDPNSNPVVPASDRVPYPACLAGAYFLVTVIPDGDLNSGMRNMLAMKIKSQTPTFSAAPIEWGKSLNPTSGNNIPSTLGVLTGTQYLSDYGMTPTTQKGVSLTYSGVGYFRFVQDAITDKSYVDPRDFGTCIENSTSPIPDTSSDPAKNGKIGCVVGSKMTKYIGRFRPFQYTSRLTGGFSSTITQYFIPAATYSGTKIVNAYAEQPLQLTVDVEKYGGGRPENYQGEYAKDLTLDTRFFKFDVTEENDPRTTDPFGNAAGQVTLSDGNPLPSKILAKDFEKGPVKFEIKYNPTLRPRTIEASQNLIAKFSLPFVQVTDTDGIIAQRTSLIAARFRSKDKAAYLMTSAADLIQAHAGRIRLNPVISRSPQDLSMPFFIEEWKQVNPSSAADATTEPTFAWQTQVSESLTGYTGDPLLGNRNAVSVRFESPNPADLTACVLDTGKPGVSGVGCPAVAGTVAHRFRKGGDGKIAPYQFTGNFNLFLAPPPHASGSVIVTGKVPLWLSCPDATAYPQPFSCDRGISDPNATTIKARAVFGRPSASIFQREVY